MCLCVLVCVCEFLFVTICGGNCACMSLQQHNKFYLCREFLCLCEREKHMKLSPLLSPSTPQRSMLYLQGLLWKLLLFMCFPFFLSTLILVASEILLGLKTLSSFHYFHLFFSTNFEVGVFIFLKWLILCIEKLLNLM